MFFDSKLHNFYACNKTKQNAACYELRIFSCQQKGEQTVILNYGR